MIRQGILFAAAISSFAFGVELSVADAVRQALAHNATIQKSSSQIRLAEQEAKQQRATLLPSLNLNSDVSRPGPNLRQDPWLNAASRNQYETVWRSSLQARWVVFDGGGNSNQLEAKEILVDAAKQRERMAMESVANSVTVAYWDAVKQNQLQALARESRQYSNERLRVVEARRQMGSANLLEEHQAILDRNADSAAELRQIATQKQALAILNWWMGRPLEDSLVLTDTIAITEASESAISQAPREMGNVPQIREAELRKNSAKVAGKSIRSEWLPEVSLYANYNFLEQYSDKAAPENGHYQGMLYGVQLSLPLFEGGKSVAQIMAAQETVNAQAQELRSLQEMWTKEVVLAKMQKSTAKDLLKLEEGNARLADSLYEASFRQFEIGSLSGMDLRRVQLSRTEAHERLVTAAFNAKIAEIQENLLLTGALP